MNHPQARLRLALAARSRRTMAIPALAAAAVALLGAPDGAAQPRCTPSAGTFFAGAADSPQLPGRVLARFGGRFACPENAEWWFEHGPTPHYGRRTASNDAAVPVQRTRRGTVVRTDVDGLAYGQTYHYRLVIRYPDGSVVTGEDAFVRVRRGALRPPQRVAFSWSRRPTPRRTVLDTLSVIDALPGSTVTVSCTGPFCKPFQRRTVLGSGPTKFRDWSFGAPGYLTVVVAGRGAGTVTTIRPRPRSGPVVATECGGYPVVMPTRCAGVSLNYQGPRVRRLSLTDVARGSRVLITCRGDGCPRRDFSRVVVAPRERPYVQLVSRGYTRARPGATLRVFITRRQTYGLTVTFRVTRRTVVRGRYRCLSPTVPLRPVACPARQQVLTGRGAAAPAKAATVPPIPTVPFQTVARGDGEGATLPRRSMTLRGEQRWRKLWDRLGDGGEPPAVDFSREMLIAVTQGRQPSSGHSIRIARIERTGRGWLVKVVETAPAKGCPAGGVLTSPYHVARVRRSARLVRFERRRAERRCRDTA